MPHDIFISYRNDSSGNIFAERLAESLEKLGYSVYFNTHARRSGDFGQRVREEVAACKDLLVVVSQGCIEGLANRDPSKTDWVREEILEARRNVGIRITPIYLDGVTIPDALALSDDPDLSFFPLLDGVVMPGDGYDVSPLSSLVGRLSSTVDSAGPYRDVSNGSPLFRANQELSSLYDLAESGDYEAMYRIGLLTFYGFGVLPQGGVDRNLDEAYRWLSRVSEECCDQGLKTGADMLIAKMYYQGVGTPEGQDYERSLDYHMRSKDDPYSAANAAYMLRIGLGCNYDCTQTESFYKEMASGGDNTMKLGLATFYENQGRPRDALEVYKSMDPIPAIAHHKMGLFYRNGIHRMPSSPDYEMADRHFRLAIEGGYLDAALDLGLLYFRPTNGFSRDFKRAEQYFTIAADAGNARAQYMLGYMFEYGHVNKSIEKAIRYFELSAAQGEYLSASHLAMLYQLPDFCNYGLAFKYCEMAASMGESQSEFMLGNFYLLGRGCEHSLIMARRWYVRAYDHGFKTAKQMLNILGELSYPTTTSARPAWLRNT